MAVYHLATTRAEPVLEAPSKWHQVNLNQARGTAGKKATIEGRGLALAGIACRVFEYTDS